MPSKVGITMNAGKERDAWRNTVEGFANWRVLMNFKTKAQAETYAAGHAAKIKCMVHPNDAEGNGPWYVYSFDYAKVKR